MWMDGASVQHVADVLDVLSYSWTVAVLNFVQR